MNHILHLLLSVFTLGLWIPVWILLALTGGEEQVRLSVDPKRAGALEWTERRVVQSARSVHSARSVGGRAG